MLVTASLSNVSHGSLAQASRHIAAVFVCDFRNRDGVCLTYNPRNIANSLAFMASPLLQAIPVLLGTWILWRFVRRLIFKDPLANIAGPEPDNFVTGGLVIPPVCSLVRWLTLYLRLSGNLARLLDKRGQAYNDELAEKCALPFTQFRHRAHNK